VEGGKRIYKTSREWAAQISFEVKKTNVCSSIEDETNLFNCFPGSHLFTAVDATKSVLLDKQHALDNNILFYFGSVTFTYDLLSRMRRTGHFLKETVGLKLQVKGTDPSEAPGW